MDLRLFRPALWPTDVRSALLDIGTDRWRSKKDLKMELPDLVESTPFLHNQARPAKSLLAQFDHLQSAGELHFDSS
jgi:hypothetical protein